ncbi:MAG: chromosome segregation protein SMC [Chloroflexota bacterium]
MPLRLKSLELHGYKTFASRTVFEFAEGITAIVGPNGSGKSNIADSLRWVLGEQTYSILRAKKTEDMIFAGSEHRPRAGMASATITFDNSNNWLPVDFSEVALSRRAYRDGRNDYLLNSQHVRLREINELLAQSGLSERTYTILGQGLVDASLALKADERRRLFEEAAGIGLYRARREEALRRLDTTKRNLERVLDIMAELTPRIRSLERQARRAEEYGAVQADLHVLLREWYGFHWHRAQQELAAARESARQQETRLAEARRAYQKTMQSFTVSREGLHELRQRLNAWQRDSSQLRNSRETISRDLAVMDERRRALQESRQTALTEQQRLGEERGYAAERLAEVDSEISRLQAELDEAKTQTDSARQAVQSRQAERGRIEQRLQQARQAINRLTAQRAERQARLDELSTRITSLTGKLASAQDAISAADGGLRQADSAHQEAAKSRQRAEAALKKAEDGLKTRQAEASDLEADRMVQAEALNARKSEHSRLEAQLEVLEQAEASLTGYAEGTRYLLEAARQSRLDGTRGALSAALDVPAELEGAVAAALGEQLDALVIASGEDAETALSLLESGEAGRAALLPLAWLAPAPPLAAPADEGCLGVASGLVGAVREFQPALDLLLGQVLVVKDRAAARRILKGMERHARAVTLRGEVFRADGLVLAGNPARSGTLGRPRQRRELQEALAASERKLRAAEKEMERLTGLLAEMQRDLSNRTNAVRQARQQLDEADAAGKQAALEVESARRQLEWQQRQSQALREELSAVENDRKRAADQGSELEAALEKAVEEQRTITSERAGLGLDEVQSQLTYWETRLAVAEQSVASARSRLHERRQSLERLEAQQRSQVERVAEIDRSLAGLETEKETLRAQEANLRGKIEALQDQIEPAEAELAQAEQHQTSLQEQELAAQRNMSAVERVYNQAQLELSRRQEALDTLRQRIEDDFGLVMFDYAENVSGPVPLPLDGMVEQLPLVKELSPDLEENLTQKRAQLRRMGAINPEAKQEYDTERERFEFMTTQVEDLRHAETDLREVIAELDELTRREFTKTFDEVAQQFRDIFVRLFGGGSARLVLTDPDNLTETGIDIEARLPGRREQGLALLSGGERSLTAIALVFSLLKVSPTPVCVLDEVDAMLDEANVGRFRDLLVELSKQTQFVIITHNRNTVQAADVIYGITMGRDSASQVISLRLDEVSDEFLGRGD